MMKRPGRSGLRETNRLARSAMVGGFAAACAVASALAPAPSYAASGNEAIAVAGYLENAWFGQGAFLLQAKLDTGANSSSINAADSEIYEKDGERWVRIDLTNRKGESWRVHLPIKRTVTIRRAGTAKEERPIVDIEVCVGGKTATSEFTLADRTGQSYQVLIGRKFMGGRLYVDSAAQYLLNHRCPKG